jgi:hypothetical protein
MLLFFLAMTTAVGIRVGCLAVNPGGAKLGAQSLAPEVAGSETGDPPQSAADASIAMPRHFPVRIGTRGKHVRHHGIVS